MRELSGTPAGVDSTGKSDVCHDRTACAKGEDSSEGCTGHLGDLLSKKHVNVADAKASRPLPRRGHYIGFEA